MISYVNVLIPPLERSFTYAVPNGDIDVRVGHRVDVPFGKRFTRGFVIEKLLTPPSETEAFSLNKIKSIKETSSSLACFLNAQIPFFTWIAEYYGQPLSNVIDVAVPPTTPRKYSLLVSLAHHASESAPKGKREKEVLAFLAKHKAPVDIALLKEQTGASSQTIKALQKKHFVSAKEIELCDEHIDDAKAPSWAKGSVILNDSQKEALAAITSSIDKKTFETFLLHGTTGSGKTEVYIEAIQHAKAQNKGALVIVPEISLTPQLIDRFRARLGNNIAVLHSALPKRERWSAWRALIEGKCSVAIGARSGIFAPVHNLGVIIVDEEHDSSYKQSEGLRYNARDLAIVRAKFENCPVVLGSATPALESFHHAISKRYRYLPLPTPHNIGEPVLIELVDLNRIRRKEMLSPHVTPILYEALVKVIDKGEQAFILYNRRGFASYLQCNACERVLSCPHCSVTLTYHQKENKLLCHYCNYSSPPPVKCEACSKTPSGELEHRGAGTERVYDELKELFPETIIDRLDRDIASSEESYRTIMDKVRSGETQILVGTQMIAKGHDLPNVTVVGVVDCDVGLHMPDFRSGERTFQLLTQASGRAGRTGKGGTVILQTRVPRNPSIVRTVTKDYPGYAELELKNRNALQYPPFFRILRIIASAQNESLPIKKLQDIRESAIKISKEEKLRLTILGPAIAPIKRIKREWRAHLIVKGERASELTTLMHALHTKTKKEKKIKVIYDIDPQDMM